MEVVDSNLPCVSASLNSRCLNLMIAVSLFESLTTIPDIEVPPQKSSLSFNSSSAANTQKENKTIFNYFRDKAARYTGALGPETYWSFKVTATYCDTPHNPGPPIIRESWLADYWSQYASYRTAELGFGIGFILAFMFGAQVLTALFAALAISKVKLCLVLSSAIFNVCSIVFVMLTSRAFTYSHYRYSFQIGFWLAAALATLFLAGSALSWNRNSSLGLG